MLMESYIEGEWKKLLLNDGTLLPKEGPHHTKHVSAFSHFSYHITEGRYMISDH